MWFSLYFNVFIFLLIFQPATPFHARVRMQQYSKYLSETEIFKRNGIQAVTYVRHNPIQLKKNSDDIELQKIDADKTDLTKSYVALGVLLLTFASNQWARQALYYLCDFSARGEAFKHINVALDFSAENYGTLASFGFTLVFAVVSLAAGSIADKYDRTKILALSCFTWSAITAVQSQATSFNDLIPLRALLGASQAFFNPAAYTVLADIFPQSLLGTVNGIFSSGIYLGGALASLSILVDETLGWRDTLVFIGAVGAVAAILCLLFVPDPKTDLKAEQTAELKASVLPGGQKSLEVGENVNNAVKALQDVCEPYTAKLLLSASTIRFAGGFSLAIWKAPFVFEHFPGSEALFAGSNALIVSVGGLTSSLLGGFISDYLANPKKSSRPELPRSLVPAVGSLLAAPCWAGFIMAPTPETAAAWLLAEYLTAECWFGPTLASLFAVVPVSRRGTAQGLFAVLTALGNLGPVLVGNLTNSGLDLGLVLLGLVSGSYVFSGVLFCLAAWEEQKKIQSSGKIT